MEKYNLNCIGYSDKGSRSNNEDTICCFEEDDWKCYIVADGLGGHGKGEEASKLAVKTALSTFKKLKNETNDLLKIVSSCFENAQAAVMDEIYEKDYRSEFKTTMVILGIYGNEVIIGHIGDSRLYVFDKHKILLQTLDHSVPQMLVQSKEIKSSQIRNHPDRNRLLRVIGIEWDSPRYEIQAKIIKLENCLSFLLCTDGFWEWIDESFMMKSLKKSKFNCKKWLEMMVCEINNNSKNKDRDNCSAICICATK